MACTRPPGPSEGEGGASRGRRRALAAIIGAQTQSENEAPMTTRKAMMMAQEFRSCIPAFVPVVVAVDVVPSLVFVGLRPCGSRGDLLVSLCYNPTANIITVNIIKARNLKAMDIGGTSDPYVKVWLMHKDKRVEKKKTVVMKRCLNPVFNESFPFDVPAHVLRETTIVITVMDKDRLSRNDVIGKIYLSWKSGPAEVKHWKDMIGHPRTTVAQWHALKA
ncbi:hypothetical protein MHYP_G00220740 [Metynnis hypsauchen]